MSSRVCFAAPSLPARPVQRQRAAARSGRAARQQCAAFARADADHVGVGSVKEDDESSPRSTQFVMGVLGSVGRRALASAAAAAAVVSVATSAHADVALTDYVSDTKDLIAQQRGLLREGKGDVKAYMAKADAYFAGYKWDHAGHTNSFSQLMNTDVVIREQNAYLEQTGGSWSPDTVPASGTPKAKILEGYLQNAERCVVKEGYPKFGDMDLEQRAEWKAITCTQGLVAPVD